MATEPRHGWRERRVAVTGAGGFIGSRLVDALVRAGASVRAMVRYNGRSDVGSLAELETAIRDAIEIVPSDITDPYAVHRFVRGSHTAFHLAALIGIPYSYEAPASYVATNVSGTLHLLEAVRDQGVELLVHTSTSETYGSARRIPIDEDHPLQPQSPYSATKIAADSLAEAFHQAFDTPVATIRPFNTYGPRQSARAIVPAIAVQLVTGTPTLRLGDVRPIRDLTFVADTVRGFLAVAETPECIGRVTNVGSGEGISIGNLARLFAEIAERPDVQIEMDPERMRPERSEVLELVADTTRARQSFDWAPRIPLREGLARTLDYVRDHIDRYDPARYSM